MFCISEVHNMQSETTKLRKRGALVIPARIRRAYGLKEGSLVSVEKMPEGVLLRPVITVPVEKYTSEQKALFLLANTVTDEYYAWAVQEVRKMGIDPDTIVKNNKS